MRVTIRTLAAVPAAVLMLTLVGCGSSDSTDAASVSSQQTAQNAADASAGTDTDDDVEPPLTGEIKQKAEEAALAAFPGTVVKSEEDSTHPGMYGVEIKQADGTTVEVYLDKTYKVTGNEKESAEKE